MNRDQIIDEAVRRVRRGLSVYVDSLPDIGLPVRAHGYRHTIWRIREEFALLSAEHGLDARREPAEGDAACRARGAQAAPGVDAARSTGAGSSP